MVVGAVVVGGVVATVVGAAVVSGAPVVSVGTDIGAADEEVVEVAAALGLLTVRLTVVDVASTASEVVVVDSSTMVEDSSSIVVVDSCTGTVVTSSQILT